MTRAAVWTVLAAAVVLASRAIVYALAPWQTVQLEQLEHKAGGPHLAVGLAAVVVIAAMLAIAVLWVAVVAVRERLALDQNELVAAPRLSLVRLIVRAVVFFGATSFAFAMFESYIHWRAGLGWHGIHCLVGPVHRDAVPILGALTLLAVSLHGAVEHVLAWARRIAALLAGRLPVLRGAGRIFSSIARLVPVRVDFTTAPRGPPVRSLSAI